MIVKKSSGVRDLPKKSQLQHYLGLGRNLRANMPKLNQIQLSTRNICASPQPISGPAVENCVCLNQFCPKNGLKQPAEIK